MKPELKQIRNLTLALFVSGALNIFLVAALFFWTFYERPPTPYFELKPKEPIRTVAISPTNASLLEQYKALPYEQLMLKLNKTGLVEDGFTERDLALAVLVGFHDFNLEKALNGDINSIQKRFLSLNEGQERITMFSGLSEEQFASIHLFAKTERWPFKTRGLLLLLNKEQLLDDPTLSDAFFLTSEFNSLQELFKGHPVSREELLKMVAEGDWGTLSAFNEKQKVSRDLTAENRERLLLTYLKKGSKTAATILLKTDYDFATKRLSDATVMQITRLLDQNNPETIKYLSTIAASPRGDQAKSLALAKFTELTGKKWEPLVSREPAKPPLEKVIALKPKTLPKAPVKKPIAEAPAPRKKESLYIVQNGDSLWKIAKRFKVSIEALRSTNKLKNDTLQPGTPLKIPSNK